jgi:hypothetical protein
MSTVWNPDDKPRRGSDIFELLNDDAPDLFESITLDDELKEDLYELIGLAVKDAMRLREGFPVRLTAANPTLAMAQIGQGTYLDQYLLETNSLIERYFTRIAQRIAQHVEHTPA